MIQMHVRDEDMAHAQEIAGGERREVAEVEQNRLALMRNLDEQRRIAGGD